MEHKVVKTMIGAVALTSTAIAGPVTAPVEATAAPSCGSFCNTLKSVGKLYKDSSNPYIQEVSLFGRFQYQAGYGEGQPLLGAEGADTFSEIRRTRLGLKVKAFNRLQIKANANLEEGGDKNHRFGYNDFDTATISYNFGDVLGVSDFALSYGRHKHLFTQEAHTSSKKIKTVERSNISNLFYGSYRPTGLVASGKVAGVKLKLGIYSTEDDSEFIGGWNDSTAYYLNAQWNKFNFDFLKNEANSNEDDIFGQDWATSIAYNTKLYGWDFMANAVYGKLSNGDNAYGLVLMPSKFIVEDKVEAVFRYQYAGSSGDNLGLARRYASRIDDTSSNRDFRQRGDSNHSLYAGLNYYLCGDNSKIQTGVEYETLENEAGNSANTTTLWAAYRMYF